MFEFAVRWGQTIKQYVPERLRFVMNWGSDKVSSAVSYAAQVVSVPYRVVTGPVQRVSEIHQLLSKKLIQLKARRHSLTIGQIRESFEQQIRDPSGFNNRFVAFFGPDVQAPYEDVPTEPEQIQQIKNILNALYHLEQGLLNIEALDEENLFVDGMIRLLASLGRHFRHVPILMSSTPLHISEAFAEEMTLLSSLAQDLSPYFGINTESYYSQFMNVNWVGKLGGQLGNLLEYTNINAPNYDFQHIVKMVHELPKQLDDLKDVIASNAPRLSTQAALIRKDYDALDKEAIATRCRAVLEGLNRIFDGGSILSNPFKWFEFYKLSKPISEILEIIQNQLDNLSDETKAVLSANLHQLKFEIFVPIIAYFDKLEAYFSLSPGVLTQPLIQRLGEIYDMLAQPVSKVVFLDTSLLSFEDMAFYRVRHQSIYAVKAKFEIKLLELRAKTDAVAEFFNRLEAIARRLETVVFLENEQPILQSLQPDIEFLNALYPLVHPFVKEFDPTLDRNIIGILDGTNRDNAPYYIEKLMQNRQTIHHFVDRGIATQEFLIEVHNDVAKHFELHAGKKFELLNAGFRSKVEVDEAECVSLSVERQRQAEIERDELGSEIRNLAVLNPAELKKLFLSLSAHQSDVSESLERARELQALLEKSKLTRKDRVEINRLSHQLQAYWMPMLLAHEDNSSLVSPSDESQVLKSLFSQFTSKLDEKSISGTMLQSALAPVLSRIDKTELSHVQNQQDFFVLRPFVTALEQRLDSNDQLLSPDNLSLLELSHPISDKLQGLLKERELKPKTSLWSLFYKEPEAKPTNHVEIKALNDSFGRFLSQLTLKLELSKAEERTVEEYLILLKTQLSERRGGPDTVFQEMSELVSPYIGIIDKKGTLSEAQVLSFKDAFHTFLLKTTEKDQYSQENHDLIRDVMAPIMSMRDESITTPVLQKHQDRQGLDTFLTTSQVELDVRRRDYQELCRMVRPLVQNFDKTKSLSVTDHHALKKQLAPFLEKLEDIRTDSHFNLQCQTEIGRYLSEIDHLLQGKATLKPAEIRAVKVVCAKIMSKLNEMAVISFLNRQEYSTFLPHVEALVNHLAAGQAQLARRVEQVGQSYWAMEQRERVVEPLPEDSALITRQSYVLKQQYLSDILSQAEPMIGGIIHKVFSQSTVAALENYAEEPDTKVDLLVKPEQIRWICSVKSIAHNANEFAKKLEQLKLPSAYWGTDFGYIWNVVFLLTEASNITSNMQSLLSDPFLKQRNLELHSLMTGILSLKDSEVVQNFTEQEKSSENKSLWHAVLGVNTLSAQLESAIAPSPSTAQPLSLLLSQKALSKAQQDALDVIKADSDAIFERMEQILKAKGSVLQTILKLPSIYKLLAHEVSPRLRRLSQLTHYHYHNEAHLIRSLGFTAVLSLLDEYEESLGLVPGILTEAMDRTFETFLTEFIKPAGLKAHDFITIATGDESLILRKQKILEQRAKYNKRLTKIEADTQSLRVIEQALNSLQPTDFSLETKKRFESQMEACLVRYFSHIKKTRAMNHSKDFLREAVSAHFAATTIDNFKNVYLDLTQGLLAYVRGENATIMLKFAYIDEKVAYLDQKIADKRTKERHEVIESAISSLVDETIKNCHAQALSHYAHLPIYATDFSSFLASMKPNWEKILVDGYLKKTGQNVEHHCQQLMANDIEAFYKANDKVYATLNELRVLSLQMMNYINQQYESRSAHESLATLKEKEACLKTLNHIFTSPDYPTKEQKIEEIKKVVDDNFIKKLSTFDTSMSGSLLTKMRRLVFKILHLLGLWVPACEKAAKSFVKVASPSYEPKAISRPQFSFFAPARASLEDEKAKIIKTPPTKS